MSTEEGYGHLTGFDGHCDADGTSRERPTGPLAKVSQYVGYMGASLSVVAPTATYEVPEHIVRSITEASRQRLDRPLAFLMNADDGMFFAFKWTTARANLRFAHVRKSYEGGRANAQRNIGNRRRIRLLMA
jgi:hypothetical protein